ncbi:DUF6538 domain-containing protein [Methylobacterium persicinum]
MRQMVGLVQRRGIFYFRRTIPEALRAAMPAVLGTAGPGIFDESASVSLKGSRAGREFWVSLATRDEDEARSRARRLDGEADALFRMATCRLTLSAKPKISELDDVAIQGLVETFRHRKLAADEAQRRGTDALSREAFDALGQAIAVREAELRDANARGDCGATHFDIDAMRTVGDAGLNIEFGSPADRRLYIAFVEAEIEVMTIIRDRQRGSLDRLRLFRRVIFLEARSAILGRLPGGRMYRLLKRFSGGGETTKSRRIKRSTPSRAKSAGGPPSWRSVVSPSIGRPCRMHRIGRSPLSVNAL